MQKIGKRFIFRLAKFSIGLAVGLYEQLSQSFPEEHTVFGLCLLVPYQAFKPEWNEQLAKEGVKVFQNSYNGRLFFFLKKADGKCQSQGLSEPQAPAPPIAQPKPRFKRVNWTPEILEKIRQLRSQGLSHRKIAKQLELSAQSVYRQMVKMGLIGNQKTLDKPKNSNGLKANKVEDDGFKEFLEAAMLVYSKGLKKACSFLLKQAANILEG